MKINDLPLSRTANDAQLKFMAVILEMEQMLTSLREKANGPAVTSDIEKEALLTTHKADLEAFFAVFAKFTEVGKALSAPELSEIRNYTYEMLHPHFLESPFGRRSFEKPLGYAGDYVMVLYLLNDALQGDTAFAQLMNFSLVQTDVAQGHRNRIRILEELLSSHARTALTTGRKAKGLTIGCGPAEETYRFVRNCAEADGLDLTLLDFNEETLTWTEGRLSQACKDTGKLPSFSYVKESVYNLAKKKEAIVPEYDFVICAGLFDYLTDTFCKRVIEFGVRSLLPGGTLMVTNVSKCFSSFGMAEILDWSLIYRTAEELDKLVPRVEGFSHKVYVDETGTNVVVEVTRHAQSSAALVANMS